MYFRSINKFFMFFVLLYLLFTGGCQTISEEAAPVKSRINIPGVYHHVEKGQTLWRISKMYDADLDELIEINKISDVSGIEIGQAIFIPRRAKVYAVPVNSVSSDDDFIWPLKGRVITLFSRTYKNMVNKGLNIEPLGSSDIVASRSGRIVFYSDRFGTFGKTLIIEHGDGFSTVYARNSDVYVKVGQAVDKGVLIAKVDSDPGGQGRYLHFQIRKKGIPQNPYFYLP